MHCTIVQNAYISLRLDRSVVTTRRDKRRRDRFVIKIKRCGEVQCHGPSVTFSVSSVSVYCPLTYYFILKRFPFVCQSVSSSLVCPLRRRLHG